MPETGRFKKLTAAAALVACAGLGCTGQVGSGTSGSSANPGGGSMTPGGGNNPGGGGSNPGGGNNPGGGTMSGTAPPPTPGNPGTSVFRRLTRTEYNNTIRDLLGDTSSPAKTFPADQDSARSGYFAGGTVAAADASHLLEATEALATSAMGKLATLLPCKAIPAAAPEQDQCAKDFITQFGKRAFRRPLSKAENTSFTDFYTAQRTAGTDFPNAIRLVISGLLLSPQFLYRWEVTPETAVRDGNLVRYNSYETASRLSYLFWESMPDDTAFALADQNKLDTPDQIEAEARRLLKDPRARGAIGDFFTQWLGVTDLRSIPKDDKAYPGYTPELADSMYAETAAFAANAILDGDGKLSTVLTSSKSFIDANLAKLYGVDGVTATTVTPTDLNPAQRAGILTQASFLSGHASAEESNPPRRGKIMADRVVCVEIPLPPDNVPDPKPPSPNLSVRERFEEHDKNPCASACHTVLDPLGFAFENYNGIGAYQSMDGGKPVNASGIMKLDGQDKPFKDAVELGRVLAGSKQVADCLNRQFLRFALRRKETVGDDTSLAGALDTYGKDNSLREMFVALTKTRSFTHRTPSTGEVLP